MECKGKFYFTSKQLKDTPSTRDGFSIIDEIDHRVKTATFLQTLGQKLKITQLCINTAIVYVKRFFMFHSMKKCNEYQISLAALFLACKTENLPVKSERIIHQYFIFLSPNKKPSINLKEFNDEIGSMVFNEILILMTLGFEVTVEHPHLHIVKYVSLIQVRKDLLKFAYFTASKSLQLTSLCLQYTPKIVACFCIHLAALKFQENIPNNKEDEPWFSCIEKNMTQEFLNELTEEYSKIFEYHEPWRSVAKKMITRRTTQSPLNLNIGISTKLPSEISENIQSPLLNHKFDYRENLSHTKNCSMFENSQNLEAEFNQVNRENGISTLKSLELKSDDHENITYFSTSNREIFESFLHRNHLTPNTEEILHSTLSKTYVEFPNQENFSFSNINSDHENSSLQNKHSTPKITSILKYIPENIQTNFHNNEQYSQDNYPRRNILENLELSTNVDLKLKNYTRHNIEDILEPFFPEISQLEINQQNARIDSFQSANESQQISLKRPFDDLNDSINKRRCLPNVDQLPNSEPQYKFNFF